MPDEVEIDIPQQGILLHLTRKEAIAFFENEKKFFASFGLLLGDAFVFGSQNFGQLQTIRQAQLTIEPIITSLQQEIFDSSALDQYVTDAREYRLIVGQGSIGTRMQVASERGTPSEVKWIAAIFASRWVGNDRTSEAVAPFRAAALVHPGLIGGADVNSAKNALSLSQESLQKIREARAELEAYIAEKQKIIGDLEHLYREKLLLEEPAALWKNVADQKEQFWKWWLGLFAIMIFSPVAIGIMFVSEILGVITHAASSGPSGGISVAGLAIVTVRALFYAWLLKNVSRVFLQNLNLADDAAHRRVMVLTFLGLAERKGLGIADAERALILNALFRPIPPHSGDEGPPLGLLEMIKNKAP